MQTKTKIFIGGFIGFIIIIFIVLAGVRPKLFKGEFFLGMAEIPTKAVFLNSNYVSCAQSEPILATEFPDISKGASEAWAEVTNGDPKDLYQAVRDGCSLSMVFNGGNTLAMNCEYALRTQEGEDKQALTCVGVRQRVGAKYSEKFIETDTVANVGLNANEKGEVLLNLGETETGFLLSDFNKAFVYVD